MPDPLVLEALKAHRDGLVLGGVDSVLTHAYAAERGCMNAELHRELRHLCDRMRKVGQLDKLIEDMEAS